MRTIIRYAWTSWIGIVPSLVGITFRDWRWWAFIVITIALVELGYQARKQENK
jgi:uncharacterized membrane protein YdbT with pleckstrin-like domain